MDRKLWVNNGMGEASPEDSELQQQQQTMETEKDDEDEQMETGRVKQLHDSQTASLSVDQMMAVELALDKPDKEEATGDKEKKKKTTIEGGPSAAAAISTSTNNNSPCALPPKERSLVLADESLPGAHAVSPQQGTQQQDFSGVVLEGNTDEDIIQDDDGDDESNTSSNTATQLAVAAEVVPSVLELENQIKERITQRLLEKFGDAESTAFRSSETSVFSTVSDTDVAQVVPNPNDTPQKDDSSCTTGSKGKRFLLPLLVLLLVTMVVAVVPAVGLRDRNADASKEDTGGGSDGQENDVTVLPKQHKTTLEAVKSRGVVRCAVTYDAKPGISFYDNVTNTWSGLNIDLCRVIAAAAVGNASKIEPVLIPFAEWPFVLINKTVDVMTALMFDYMSRDVWETKSKGSFSFAPVFARVGLQFAGLPEYVDCADRLDSFHGPCRELSICMQRSSTHEKSVAAQLPGAVIVPQESNQDMPPQDFLNGNCNVMAHSNFFSQIDEQYMRSQNYTGPYKIGSRLFSRQAFSFPTLDDDTEWSSLVHLAVNALFTAEALNITQASVKNDLLQLPALDTHKDFRDLLIDVISAVGNTGSFLGKPPQKPRSGINRLVTDEDRTGLILSIPFGNLENQGMYLSGGVIDTLLHRGFLRCGVTRRLGFASTNGTVWTGMDVEYCRALAAALFSPNAQQSVQYVEITNSSEGFSSLSRGDVDVLAGEHVNLLNTWREPSTGKGYTYSTPYFYGSRFGSHSYALVTRQDDSQWSDFVNWVIMSTFYAEENLISQNRSVEMPVVRLFGEQLKQMFRDCIFAVGSYGDIYNRTLEATIPRSGRNTLNDGGPMQFAYPYV